MATKRTIANRLKTLHSLLKGLKPRQYDHSIYYINTARSNPKTCGTVGCALGHAVTSGKFRNLEIHRVDNELYSNTENSLMQEADEFFGEDAYEKIFSMLAYHNSRKATRSQVLKRIREFTKHTTGYTFA